MAELTGFRGAALRAAQDAETTHTRRSTKQRMFDEQRGLCWICQKLMRLDVRSNDPVYATFDHLKARALGGSDEDHNLKLAHKLCNERRGTGSVTATTVEHRERDGPMPFTSAWLLQRGYLE